MTNRLFVKVTRCNLPQVKEKYPYLYLERGRLEVDDSSVKWIDCEGAVIRIPCAVINALLLGPGTSITHEAVKVLAAANCTVSWVGEDSMLFYAVGQSPTADTRNLRKQMELAADPNSAVKVARRMFERRFPAEDVAGKDLGELKGMEGLRIRQLYEEKAGQYGVGWIGRRFLPGKFEMSDTTNRLLTSLNAALYGILTASVYSLGYSPHIGFIHSGSPLPFIYDIADLYKDEICIDTAFYLTREMGGCYNRELAMSVFRERVLKLDLLSRVGKDINEMLEGGKHAGGNRKSSPASGSRENEALVRGAEG